MASKNRRLRKVQVSLVSLLSKGANRQPALLKGDDKALTVTALAKADLEGLLHCLVYIPDRLDSHGDWMSREDVRYSAHHHMGTGAKLDLHHDLNPLSKEQAYPVEHFILQGQDARFPDVDRDGAKIEHAGAWAMIVKLEDPSLLEKAKAGQLNEVSLYAQGGAYEAIDEDLPLGKSAAGNSQVPPKNTMDAKELAEALAKSLAPLQTSVEALTAKVAELQKTAKPETTPDTKAPVEKDENGRPIFKGDPTDSVALLKHARACEDIELVESFKGELGNPEAVQALVKCQTKLRQLRKEEDQALGIVSGGVGASLRKSLLSGNEQSPGDTNRNPKWMEPSDKDGFKSIMGEARSLLKSQGRAKPIAEETAVK